MPTTNVLRMPISKRMVNRMHAIVREPITQEPAVAKLTLRRDKLAQFRGYVDLNTDISFAKRLNMDKGQVSRILLGKSAPGTRFIAGCLTIWGIDAFPDLFAVVDDDTENGADA